MNDYETGMTVYLNVTVFSLGILGSPMTPTLHVRSPIGTTSTPTIVQGVQNVPSAYAKGQYYTTVVPDQEGLWQYTWYVGSTTLGSGEFSAHNRAVV